MTSELAPDFVACYRRLPGRVKQLARSNYRIWRENPSHPGLNFKLVGTRIPVYSVRIGIGWRALEVRSGNRIVWFWIGSHAEYDRLLKSM